MHNYYIFSANYINNIARAFSSTIFQYNDSITTEKVGMSSYYTVFFNTSMTYAVYSLWALSLAN